MSIIYRVIIFFSVLIFSIYCDAQSNVFEVPISETNQEKIGDKTIVKFNSKCFNSSAYNPMVTKVLIFIDTNNMELQQSKLAKEIAEFKEEVVNKISKENFEFYFIKYSRPITSAYFFEFSKRNFAVKDYPVFVLHGARKSKVNLIFDSKFSYSEAKILDNEVLHLKLNPGAEGQCSKINFVKPLHSEILEICMKVSILEMDIVLRKDDVVDAKKIEKAILLLTGRIDTLTTRLKSPRPVYNNFEVKANLSTNYRSIGAMSFYHDDHWAPLHIYLGFSVSNYYYSKNTGFHENINKSTILRIYDISEIGNLSMIGADLGVKYVWSLAKSPMTIHLSGGVRGNGITRCDYQWTSGTMDIRGKVAGIGDEIINVPDLGYRDGISLVGVQGQSNIKRFFPSASIDVAFHYNLEKVDFFTGVGYTYSSQLKPVHPDALVSDGTRFNSLISTTNPIAIRTPYFSIGASLNF